MLNTIFILFFVNFVVCPFKDRQTRTEIIESWFEKSTL